MKCYRNTHLLLTGEPVYTQWIDLQAACIGAGVMSFVSICGSMDDMAPWVISLDINIKGDVSKSSVNSQSEFRFLESSSHTGTSLQCHLPANR